MVSHIEYEYWLIRKLIYKMKNQLGNTLLYRRFNQLKRFLHRYIENNKINGIKEIWEKTFLLATSNLEMGHFISLSLIIMGICARVCFLVSKEEIQMIDDLFESLE